MQSCIRTTEKYLRQSVLRAAPSSVIHVPTRRALRSQHRQYASVSAAELQFGQPLHETHPHLLKAGERKPQASQICGSLLTHFLPVTPGITALEYAQRRSRLAARLPHNGIAIIAASDIKYRSGAVFYDFHQDSNFFYFTGTEQGRKRLGTYFDDCRLQ